VIPDDQRIQCIMRVALGSEPIAEPEEVFLVNRDSDDAMTVNWLEMEIADATGKVTYRNSFVTDLPVDADTVAELVAAGRARWKIENESFNVLKTKGYNLEHNFGHGRENLSAVLATLNLLAFAFHTLAESTEDLWQKAAAIAGTRAGPLYENARNRGLASCLVLAKSLRDSHLPSLAFPVD
jgi:hypothetical protein